MSIDIKLTVTVPEKLITALDALAYALAEHKPALPTALNAPPVMPKETPVTPVVPTQAPVQSAQPVQPVTPVQTAVPTTAPTYTAEQLAVAATQLVDAGRRAELVSLLNSFGVQALTALPKDQYGTFATKLREMGAKI